MTRRKFVPAMAAGALAARAQSRPPSVFEIRTIRFRNTTDNQRQRFVDFLQQAVLPGFARAKIGPAGFFSSSIAGEGPFIVAIASFPSLAAMEERRAKFAADTEYKKALDAYNASPNLNYERIDSMLVRAFPAVPEIEVPTDLSSRPPRIFELRCYESNNTSTLARKIKMFETGEIAIFRRLGMRPVFFAETVIGPRMPNLIYMLSFDDLASREKAWRAFGADPDWQKLRSLPGNSDAEIVSNNNISILQPLPFSPIR
jgi:hypothetical protein